MILHNVVPARFLTIIAHLVITITIFFSREENVLSCIPDDFSEDEKNEKDKQLLVALSLSLACFVIELIGFLTGMSMFSHSMALLSIGAHLSAAVSLSFFVIEAWSCDVIWYVFAFCSALPAFLEIGVMCTVLQQRR
eukprot:m.17443 g.17443  ORF g.17443 m.17443 type:complete len:137 (+) comp27504_c0_seq8:86-496(+)